MNGALRWRAGPDKALAPGFAAAILYGLALTILLWSGGFQAREAEPLVLVVYGDSLSAGYQLAEKDSFPAQLEQALKARGHNVRVVNASVSGDTTAAGLTRFDWSFPEKADAAILELGANDALRGLKPETTRANLDKLLTKLKARNVEPLLAGMLAPRNMGVKFTQAFDRIYPELAAKHDVPLYPFFLFDVVGKRELNLDDGLHPNPAGVKKIVEQILPKVETLLKKAAARIARTQ